MSCLYKYRAMNSNGLKLLANKELYFSKPEHLNDPLDYQIPLTKILQTVADEENDPQLKNIFQFLIQHKTPNIDTGVIENHIEKIQNGLKKMGILSLSKNPVDPLLWAHYADEHRGFCIGFEYNQIVPYFMHKEIHGDDILYRENFDSIKEELRKTATNLNAYMDSEKVKNCENLSPQQMDYFYNWLIFGLSYYCFRLKSEDWDYEEEFRFISNSSGVIPFPASSIKKIIFGLKMEDDEKKTIRNILGSEEHSQISYKEVVRSAGDFDFKLINCPTTSLPSNKKGKAN